jgi:hypothetical protein
MAITVKLYGITQRKVVQQDGADVDIEATTAKLSLHSNAMTVDRDAHDFFNDVSASEIAGANGYAVQTLGGKSVTYDSASHQVRFDCNDIVFSFTGSNTWRYGVAWIDTAGASSTDPLYGLLTWDSDQTVSTTYTLVIHVNGLFFWDVT